ncbi:MAG: alpha/beta fold hydrolase, partial [Bradymonadaceae bacterium]
MTGQNREPFEQIPYEDLPEKPRRSHAYEQTAAGRVQVATAAFGNVDTHYRVYGSGPPLLLVHGLMTSSYSWRYVFEPLGERYTLYAPDLPGTGETDKVVDAAYTPKHLAEWIGAFQRVVEIRGCPVVGNSLGGYLCMWLALREPEAMARLVNLHSPGIPTARLKLLRTLAGLPGLPRLVAWWARRHPNKWAHRRVHYYDESLKSKEESRAYGRPISSKEGSRTFVKYLTETMDTRRMRQFVDELEHRRQEGLDFPVPLLLLYADRDPM